MIFDIKKDEVNFLRGLGSSYVCNAFLCHASILLWVPSSLSMLRHCPAPSCSRIDFLMSPSDCLHREHKFAVESGEAILWWRLSSSSPPNNLCRQSPMHRIGIISILALAIRHAWSGCGGCLQLLAIPHWAMAGHQMALCQNFCKD